MTFEEYDKFVASTWFTGTDKDLENLFVCTAGLAGETGEVCEKLKKWVRDGTFDQALIVKELGDVLYYLTTISRLIGSNLTAVVESNEQKIKGRIDRGTQRGSGDGR